MQASSTEFVRGNHLIKQRINRYEQRELGLTERSEAGIRDTSFSRRSSVHHKPERHTAYNDTHPISTNERKFEDIYQQLQDGLYDRKSVGTIDIYSKGRAY